MGVNRIPINLTSHPVKDVVVVTIVKMLESQPPRSRIVPAVTSGGRLGVQAAGWARRCSACRDEMPEGALAAAAVERSLEP